MKDRESKKENEVEEDAIVLGYFRATARYSRMLRTDWKYQRFVIVSLLFQILKSMSLISPGKFSKME